MIHAAAPHFLWLFAVRYAAHQLNLWPRVSEPETSPTLQWTGKVGDASVFRVWGVLSLVCDAKASKLSSCTLHCVFLGFPTDAQPWQFYHPRSRQVLSSQDITFDEFVCYYRLHPHASHPGPAPSGVSRVDPSPLVEPLDISSDSSGPDPPGFPPRLSSSPPQPAAVDSGAETAGAEPWGAEIEGEGSGVAATGGASSGGAAKGVAGSWGAATGGADSGGPTSPRGGGAVGDPAGGPGVGQPPQPDLLETLSLQAIRAWIVRRGSPGGGGYGPAGAGAASPGGTAGAGGTGGTAGGAGGAARAGGTRGDASVGGAGATSPRGATGVGGAGPTSLGGTAGAGGAGGVAGAGGAGAGGTVGAGAAGTALRRPFFYRQLQSSLLPPDSVLRQLLPGSLLPVTAPHTEVTESLTERHEPETRASTPGRARRVARPRPLAVPGTHGMALRPSSVPQCVVLPKPPASSLPHVPDPESGLACAASPTVTRLLATVVTDPDLESTTTFSLVTELVNFASGSRLNYIASLVTESESVCLPSVGGELALGNPDALDIPTPRSYIEAIAGEYSSQWQTAMDAEMAFWKCTGTYVDEAPPPGANIVDGMWIFRVKWPPGSPPAFKARYVARGFRQRQGVNFFHTFSLHPEDDYSSGVAAHCSTA
ncbi:unnamed protein product [Closterium sp. NIES-54]